MTISYVTYARMPTEKAHGVQIVSMCTAYAALGHTIELVTPLLTNPISESITTYYHLSRDVAHRRVRIFDLVGMTKSPRAWHYYLNELQFAFRCVFLPLPKDALVHTRSALLAPVFRLRGRRVVCESHFWPGSGGWLYALLLRAATVVACNSEGTKDACVAHGVRHAFVAQNAIDGAAFENVESKHAARMRLGIPQDIFVVMYIGALDAWKGVETLCQAAGLLADAARVYVIGGKSEQVQTYTAKYPNVTFLGSRPYHELPHNQQAADVLVVPNSPESKESESYTSPIKLYAHMASGVPVLVSDLPSMRAIAGEDMLRFFEAGNADALATAVRSIVADPSAANVRARQAREFAFKNTWQVRVENILAAITHSHSKL